LPYQTPDSAPATPILLLPVDPARLNDWLDRADARHRRWVGSSGFEGKPGQWCALPSADGGVEAVLFGSAEEGSLGQLASLATTLPAGTYRLDADWNREQRNLAALGWGLAQYRFDRYRAADPHPARLLLDEDIATDVQRLHAAQVLVRDLVNTPTEDLGPEELVSALGEEAKRFDARFSELVGDDLLAMDYPTIHTVGRAAARAPRLGCLEWGDPEHPLVALVGKGVCFDSGGLDIKPAAGMLLMKKDMGGAAHVIALARLIMEFELPVRLLVLVPAVENAISGNAYRPGDVIRTRQGLTVEIGNTDAEGRLVLSDALTRACEDEPDLLLDFATLTGAARVAMGADIPPVFSNRSEVAHGLMASGREVEDPVWELPLHRPYLELMKSQVADINNTGKGAFAGCITAALFLEKFVAEEIDWAHFDTFAWNQADRPGRPAGGEALGLRAAFEFIRGRYA
jgi:leucyl aminopeptidase